ncbi:zinc finger protein, putative, partial [Bodo saltans]
IMQAQMIIGQAFEQFVMLDLSNRVLENCWDVCFDKNITRKELVAGDIEDAKLRKMDACQRKCIARHFEVMKLMNESREMREREAMMGLPPGALKEQQKH